MSLLALPWLEIALAVSVLGALVASRLTDPLRAMRWGLACTAAVLAATVLAWLAFYLGVPPAEGAWDLQQRLLGRRLFSLDELSAPLVPLVAVLHFLTALATARTKMRRFSVAWSLTAEALRLATFSCREPWPLIVFLALGTIPPYQELLNRGRSVRVYVLHMTVFLVLLILGWALVQADRDHGAVTTLASICLMAAVLVRTGTIPAHVWIIDWFENASFGIALLFVAPLTGVYAAVRLVLPVAPDWVLSTIGVLSLVTAVYAAGMALVQREARRFFAYLFLSHSALVFVGLELVGAAKGESLTLTGSLSLWFSVVLSLGGFGLTLRAIEARLGRVTLARHQGLYDSAPTLAVCFLLTGLASVGFPGTLGFISAEMLVDGAVDSNLAVGLGVIAAGALNSIAVLRGYFLIFTGGKHTSTVSLRVGVRERIAVLTLAALILGGGLYPQPGVLTRARAAEEILRQRQELVPPDNQAPPGHADGHGG